MVAADNAMASQVGATILEKGGDAVDSAVAVALYLGVVQPFASGIGGGGFAVVHRAGGESYALDFREMAPAAAHRDMYLDQGHSFAVRQSHTLKKGQAPALEACTPMWSQYVFIRNIAP